MSEPAKGIMLAMLGLILGLSIGTQMTVFEIKHQIKGLEMFQCLKP
jgi:hypothetical protein